MSEPAKKSREDDVVHPLGALENLSQSLWLVKVPQYLCERWASAAQDELLGHFAAAKSAAGQRQFVVKLLDSSSQTSDDANGSERDTTTSSSSFPAVPLSSSSVERETKRERLPSRVPLDLVVAEIPRPQNAPPETIVAFSSDAKKRKFSLEGRVSKRFVLRPQSQREFADVMRERARAELARKQLVEVREVDEEERARNLGKTIDLSVQETRQTVKRQSAVGAGSREEQIRKKVFSAFEQSDYLTFQELHKLCLQIDGYAGREELKNVLDEFAFFNRQGQHRNFYELKAEYRLNAE